MGTSLVKKHPNYYIIWRETAALLLTDMPSLEIITAWYESDDLELQHFCVNHAIQKWQTGIGIIEAIHDMLYNASANGNFAKDWEPA